ncbi:winged helix-turn-helix transcriptional regulator [Sulfitobacter sp. S0837]|uniref:MarR family winged helix-turn-helix transcriptional regulator n=1 Tax=Sulfitobacter maritimus TaxID=2741719 RepID=UPI00158322D9|nr:MarR family winged helix-turn-helix transcriptional regulator [Sulfitobacter maritimus]NUH66590.1 winged helix-turn-helix transcriptional regulator [Sulfitobacter maritimus]
METDNFDLQDFLPYLLNQAAEASSLEFQKYYKNRYGMLRTEWRVLFHLGLYGQLTASEIGQRARMHKTKISRAVHRLTERRFVTRRRDEDDRRVEHLALTRQGLAAYAELRDVAQRYDAELLNALDPAEAELLRRVLRKLSEARPGGFT